MKINRQKLIATAIGLIALLIVVAVMAPALRAADGPTVLITGSNRGIGYEFARQYADKGWNVIATCRKPAEAEALQAVAAQYPNLAIEQMDVTDHAGIDALAEKYEGQAIDVIVNNAGISGDGRKQNFGSIEYDTFDLVMNVNVLGPLKVAEAFIDNVSASEQKKIMTVSSSQGSISETSRQGGRLYFYRSSKSAVNMTMNILAKDVKDRGVIIGLLAPGATDTDLMKGVKMPLGDPKDRVAGLIDVIDSFTPEMSGHFVEYTGRELGW